MEPSLEQIEDYNGKESVEKKRTVRAVILFLLSCGIVYAVLKNYYDTHTPESMNPIVEKQGTIPYPKR
jgi:hypothetical protein